MQYDILTSTTNERVKLAYALQNQAKTRRKENMVVLEGVRLIADALDSGYKPNYVIYMRPSGKSGGQPLDALLTRLDRARVPLLEAAPEVMQHITDTETPQGIIAVVPRPSLAIMPDPGLILVLDGVADPGNMGTILRTAAAAGVDGCVLLPGCVEPYNPKTLRAGMGAHFRLPLESAEAAALAERFPDLPFYLADADAELPYDAVDWRAKCGLVIGGEAHGADPRTYSYMKNAITIPMNAKAESLNAGSAAAVILFEAVRQRRKG